MRGFVYGFGVYLGRRPDGRWRLGIWPGGITLVLDRGVYCFRPPWNRPLFSEREGCHRFVFKRGGWRLFVREHTI